ncbi:DUF636 domain-containing protein [Neohortaea acidophila]|uniref:DUF636 domain-containing protein n=1 Tax=Neohortaea acidophila TaxID=245834 RepID=A0A6A6PQB3_9PEZI|nr:DUF636 domain-containing protein [Neohortaea acidophila]KAF2481633.1 DUF636 domain-containing protein [Neohortaea acidophila]
MSTQPTGTRKTYEANCHCGNIRYTVTLDDALYPEGKAKINRCNCSICTKNGYLLVYPKREDVVFQNDSEARLKDYFFGKKNKPHRFCPECSSSVLIDFKNSDVPNQRGELAINARLFKDIDLDKAAYTTYDGRNKLGPVYQN